MPSYKNFTATIYDTSTGRPLQEYMSSFNPITNICQTYIESHHNQPFTIVLRDDTLLPPAASHTPTFAASQQPQFLQGTQDSGFGPRAFEQLGRGDPVFEGEGISEGRFAQGTAVHIDGVYVDNGLTGPGIAIERRWYGKRVDHVFVKPFVFRENTSGNPDHPFSVIISACFGLFVFAFIESGVSSSSSSSPCQILHIPPLTFIFFPPSSNLIHLTFPPTSIPPLSPYCFHGPLTYGDR
jgi:hypothetical protein